MKYKTIGPNQIPAICPMKDHSPNESCLIRLASCAFRKIYKLRPH